MSGRSQPPTFAHCAGLAGADPGGRTPPGQLTIADEVKVSAWMVAAALIRRVWEQETDLDGFHQLKDGPGKAWMTQALAVIACDLLAELTEATARLSPFGKKSTPRRSWPSASTPIRWTQMRRADQRAERAIAPAARHPGARRTTGIASSDVKDHDDKDHEGMFGKIFIFTAAPAISAGAIATGPGALSHYHLTGGSPPSAAYGVATTGYAGIPDHADSSADFPLAAIPQPGTAAIHFNILGPGD